jgi:hypothetical protein
LLRDRTVLLSSEWFGVYGILVLVACWKRKLSGKWPCKKRKVLRWTTSIYSPAACQVRGFETCELLKTSAIFAAMKRIIKGKKPGGKF